MTPPAITDNNATQHTKRSAVAQILVALKKAGTTLVLIVVLLGLVLLGLTQPNWEPSLNVGVEPFSSAATTIDVYAEGCGERRINVQERNDEIRVSAEHKRPNTAGYCDSYEREVIELDEAVGSRQIVNANTNQPIEPSPCQILTFHSCWGLEQS